MYKLNNCKNFQALTELFYEDIKSKNDPKTAKQIISQTDTSINKYALPDFNFFAYQKPKAGRKDIEAAILFRSQLPVEVYRELKTAFDKTVSQLNCSKNICYVYRSRLNYFVQWCEDLFSSSASNNVESKKDCCPTHRFLGYGCSTTLKVTNRIYKPNYGLPQKDFSDNLCQELAEFERFRTAKNYPYRLQEPIKPDCWDNLFKNIRLMLGWHHRYRNISLDCLSLSILVPKVGMNIPNYPYPINTDEDVADYVDFWCCQFLDFLVVERECKSPHTLYTMLMDLNSVAKFHNLKLGASNDYHNIPVVNLIHRRLKPIGKEKLNHKTVIDVDLKWLDLPDVITKVVEPLRQECKPRYYGGIPREPKTIVDSLQRYGIMGCLTYLPPRRQQEWRNARISLSCPIERPSHLPPSGFIHPLPPPSVRHQERFFPYLYYSQEGKWLLDLPPESYKTGKTHGYQVIEIPNRQFDDGTYFYDYLEMFIYGFYCLPDGTLAGAGSQLDYSSEKLPNIIGGRFLYNCNHNYFYSQQNGKRLTGGSLRGYVKKAVFGKTGKGLTPHLLRDIYATYFLDMEYSDAVISALAYSMGHTVEELRKSYDARRSGDKRRPIETALNDVLDQILGVSSFLSHNNKGTLQQILELLPRLSSTERAKLKQII